MIGYRSAVKQVQDNSASYTATVGGTPSLSSCAYLLANNTTFNESVVIGNNVGVCNALFWNCTNFNKPITLPSNVYDCMYMFYGASKFNSKVTIENNTIGSLGGLFYGSNCQIPLDANVKSNDMGYLYSFSNFNNVFMMNYGTYYWQAFMRSKMNSNCYLPNSVIEMGWLFYETPFFSNLFIRGGYRDININRVFDVNVNGFNTHRKNVYFNSELTNVFSRNDNNSLIGKNITWAFVIGGNTFYNSAYNIYCYNNLPLQ